MASIAPEVIPNKPPGLSGRRKIFLGLLLLALLGFGVWRAVRYFSYDRHFVSTDNAYVEADIAAIAPKVQGYIRDVLVQDNQRVQKGDVLATIDDRDYRAKLIQSEATVATRRAIINNAAATAEKQVSAIAAAKSEIVAKKAEAVRASEDLQRFAKLRKEQWISQQRYQTADADAARSQADVDKAQSELKSQQSQIDVLKSQTKVAAASFRESLAAVETARLDVENCVLRAPVDGVVGNKAVRVGQYVRAGSLLMAVVPMRDVYVVANYKETQLQKVREGQHVKLHVDAYPDADIQGIVDSISPAAGSRFSILPPENATGNFTKIVQRLAVKIRLTGLPNDVRLTPGMSVETEIDTRSPHSPPTKPQPAQGEQRVAQRLSVAGK